MKQENKTKISLIANDLNFKINRTRISMLIDHSRNRLQASLNEAQGASERVERSLSERLQQATIQLAAAQERERTAAEQYMQASSKTASLESKLSSATKERASLASRLEAEEGRRAEAEADREAAAARAERARYGGIFAHSVF